MVDIDSIVNILNEDGKVIAIKTDTVYGLICNAFDNNAVKKIYSIKNREERKPLSIFVKNISEVRKYVLDSDLSKEVLDIANKFWPGALTIIFSKKDDTLKHLTALNTGIGIRIPNDKTLLDILDRVDFPLAETSCNMSGEKELSSSKEIFDRFGNKIDLIVDGGEIKNSVPSTVISVIGGTIKVLRLGDINLDERK